MNRFASNVLLGACALAGCILGACAATFESSAKAPGIQPLELRGEKVAAVVLMTNQSSRQRAEDTLAAEITKHGAQGIAMYKLVDDPTPANEPSTRATLENAAVKGVVVMRPISVDNKVEIKPVTYLDPHYAGYWGGYYGQGLSAPYTTAQPVTIGTEIKATTVVYVETLVYSLRQNKLAWSGRSKTTDPPQLEAFVRKLATDVASELESQGLIKR